MKTEESTVGRSTLILPENGLTDAEKYETARELLIGIRQVGGTMDDVLKTMRPNKGLGARLPLPTKNGPTATSVNSALARASGIAGDEDDEFPPIVTEGKQ